MGQRYHSIVRKMQLTVEEEEVVLESFPGRQNVDLADTGAVHLAKRGRLVYQCELVTKSYHRGMARESVQEVMKRRQRGIQGSVGLLRRALEAVTRGIEVHPETRGGLAGKNSNTASAIREKHLNGEMIGIGGMEVEVGGKEGEVVMMGRARKTSRIVRDLGDELIGTARYERIVLYLHPRRIKDASAIGVIPTRKRRSDYLFPRIF